MLNGQRPLGKMSSMKKKRCSKCGKQKPVSEFGKRERRGKVECAAYCRLCMNAYHVERRKNNPVARKAHRDGIARRRVELREELQAYKAERPCVDCGYHYNPWQMQFDHPVGSEKVGNVSDLVKKTATRKLWAEIEKCELVCANCHADRTHARRQGVVAQ